MPRFRFSKRRLLVTIAIIGLLALGAACWHIFSQTPPESAAGFLEEGDRLAWLDNWPRAAPYYRRAELLYRNQADLAKELYCHVSQIPARMEYAPMPVLLRELDRDLALTGARDSQTRLRILVVKGIVATNYDAAIAFNTWQEVRRLASRRQQMSLAMRALGEEGLQAFILGRVSEGRKDVVAAYLFAKYSGDKAAYVHYVSYYGAGIVQAKKYQEALESLNAALATAKSTPDIGFPSIAYDFKIHALIGLHQLREAKQLTDEALVYPRQHQLAGHLSSLLSTRARILEEEGNWQEAIIDLKQSAEYAQRIAYWRGLCDILGDLALAYEHEGKLQEAQATVSDALDATKNLPDELYPLPGTVGLQARIEAELGNTHKAEQLYQKASDLLDVFLASAPGPSAMRGFIDSLGTVYSGYFALLASRGDYANAFAQLEKARGRVETQLIRRRPKLARHEPSAAERNVNAMELKLLSIDDKDERETMLHEIYDAEQQLDPGDPVPTISTSSAPLRSVQERLRGKELLLEYVLGSPHSYVLAITQHSVRHYQLSSRSVIEDRAEQYSKSLTNHRENPALARTLFADLLNPVKEYAAAESLVIVADGQLHLVPFGALLDANERYVIESHTVAVAPSGTVLQLLRSKAAAVTDESYLGVAAWTQAADPRPFVVRWVSSPNRKEFVPLPQSANEVETAGQNFPEPRTVLLGKNATEVNFRRLPLERYRVIHLALHGYVDTDFPDRSALVFAPSPAESSSGLLQAREIRQLPLNAELVVLSACNSGVGPVGGEGVANLAAAFLEAGARTVLSTLWRVEDHATASFMDSFYKHLAAGETKSRAVQATKLEFIRQGKPAPVWAAFAVAGDASNTLISKHHDTH